MTGSEMGTLVVGFARFFGWVAAAILLIIALLTKGLTAAILAIVALGILAAVLWSGRVLRKKERAYYAERAENERQARLNNPYYGAYCRLKEVLDEAELTGSYTTGQGRHDGKDTLFVYISEVNEWDGDQPKTANGLPFRVLQARIPALIGFNGAGKAGVYPVLIKVTAKPPVE